MKKLLLISMLAGALPMALMAQDDDLYFTPKKRVVVETSNDRYGMPKDTYYSGSDRSVDEYNRRMKSQVEALDGDSAKSDIISFDGEKGVYPDSTLSKDDYKYTKRMSRFDDYRLSDNAAFWAGYHAGVNDWGWHSPWYYTRYGWYDPWFDPWFDPWYYSAWYDPWYYDYAGWYSPWYYNSRWYWGWRPYYSYPRYVVVAGGGGRSHSGYIGTGTLRRDGTHYSYRGGLRGSVAGNSSRMSSMRDRARQMGGSRTYSSGNYQRSRSGNFSGYRGSSSNSTFSGSRSSGGSFGGSRGGGGGFSGGHSGGGGRSGGGGLGGRR